MKYDLNKIKLNKKTTNEYIFSIPPYHNITLKEVIFAMDVKYYFTCESLGIKNFPLNDTDIESALNNLLIIIEEQSRWRAKDISDFLNKIQCQ